MPPAVLTVGHSNHPLDRFLALLARHGVEALVDVRRFPGSRKHPHFNRDNLAASLQEAGVAYHWLEALGGRRPRQRDESPNGGLENQSFRNYADYMLTDAFRAGVESLLEVARAKRTAVLCAEGLFWQCHRRLVSDFLTANGVPVQHIMPAGELRPHTLTRGAVTDVDRGLKEGHFCAMRWGHDELPADPQFAICSPRRRPVPFASIDGTPNSLAQFDRRSIQSLARAGPRFWPHAKALLTPRGRTIPCRPSYPMLRRGVVGESARTGGLLHASGDRRRVPAARKNAL